ncbi:MAG: division/cell wall cluster transcriptional repressor MraZ [Oscillospiraceae bacterium]|nr:division/cell wall cluster transcriptional repressor MraZ [Oscillospiraceae bacterium]
MGFSSLYASETQILKERRDIVLIGKYQNSIDQKGRIIFPAKFREDMGENIVLAKGFFDKCLCAYGESEWKRLCESLKNFPEAKVRQVRSWLFGSACLLTPDKQGRVFISQELVKHAELDHDVIFIGMDSRVELWNSENYDKMYSSITPENIADVLTQLDF